MALLEAQPSGRRLEHLSGLRFFLILWVVLFHAGGEVRLAHPNALQAITNNLLYNAPSHGVHVHYAVQGFIVMSGFVMHWTHGARAVGFGRGLVLFYCKRFDRVLLTTWLAMALQLGFASTASWPWSTPGAGRTALCFLQLMPFVDSSWEAIRLCPDPPAWTISVLTFQWLLYPLLTQRVLHLLAARTGDAGLLAAMLLSQAVIFGVDLIHLAVDQLNAAAVDWLYLHPLANVLPFFFGAAVASLADRHRSLAPPAEGKDKLASSSSASLSPVAAVCLRHAWVLADGCMAGLLVMSLVNTHIQQTFGMHLAAVLWGGFFYGSAVGWTPGFFAGRLALPVFTYPGLYAFEVYILHWPLLNSSTDPMTPWFDRLAQSFAARLLILASLWAVAAIYANYFQNPITDWLRAAVSRWAKSGQAANGALRREDEGKLEAEEVANENTPLLQPSSV